MSEAKVSPPAPLTPEEIKAHLLKRFKALPESDLQKMRELQRVVRMHVPANVSLSDDLIEERRKERT